MDKDQRNGRLTEYNQPWIEQRADPYVYRHTDGLYYFTASVPAYDKVVLRRANSLAGLEKAEEVPIWFKHETGQMSEHIWAPEIHFLQGKWYIYYAAGEKEDVWKIRPYVLECQGPDPMKDPWKEMGKMERADEDIYSFEAFSLDATVFEHKDQLYFLWAEKVSVGIQISNLYIAKMASPTKLASEQILLSTPDYDWERAGIWVNEGPAVIKRNGKIFLTYSASATGKTYCMGMLTIDEDDDLLIQEPGKRNGCLSLKPVLKKGYSVRDIILLPRQKTVEMSVSITQGPMRKSRATLFMMPIDMLC